MLRAFFVGAALVGAFGTTYASQDRPTPNGEQVAPQAPKPEAPPPKRSVAGVYLCEGANPDGSAYQGLVEIIAVDNTYVVHWVMADGAEVLGVGIRSRDVLSVSYFGGTPAVAVYRIDGDRLIGEWTMGGAEGKLYSETLTRMPDQKPARPRRTQPPVAPVGSRSI
jgi:hypothetical protein